VEPADRYSSRHRAPVAVQRGRKRGGLGPRHSLAHVPFDSLRSLRARRTGSRDPHAMKTACLLLAGVALSSLTLAADTYPRQPAVDAIHYRFALTLSEESTRIDAEATATLRLVAPAEFVELDLISSSGDKGMTVSRVTAGGRPIEFSHQANRLRLSVPKAATTGTDVSYTITYGGMPGDGLKVVANMHGERSVFSENWPNRARHWLPTIDHPYDKATGEMIVTAPAHQQVISNGVLVEEVDLGNGLRRTHWRQSVPIASWLYAVGVARFDVHHAGEVQGVPLQTWVFPQDRDAGRAVFEETSRRAMDFFSTRVGPYPYEKLANVQAAGPGGGMENATAIFYGEKGVADGGAPVVHEIAHQWFGNSVTERDWDDVWLSEGFATYFALLYIEQFDGRDAFVEGLRRSRATVLEQEKKRSDRPIVHRNLADMQQVINPLTYQKGAWVLHMLRHETGSDAFWSGIREYYRRFRDRNASTDDLRQVMEQASGKNLRTFFAQWLTRSGVPHIRGSWRHDPTARVVEITLEQTQPGEPYQLAVTVRVTAEGSDPRLEHLRIAGTRQTFTVPTTLVPISVTLDPETTLLADLNDLDHRP
jgi:aminopeptidase N